MLDTRTISTGELRQRLDHGHIPRLWNVLTSQYFTGEIIPGSTRMPLDTIGHATTSVPKDAEIITYCGGPKCPQSAQTAQRLIELRLHKRAGIRGWTRGLESGGTLRRNASRAGTGGMIGRRQRFGRMCGPPARSLWFRGGWTRTRDISVVESRASWPAQRAHRSCDRIRKSGLHRRSATVNPRSRQRQCR